MYSSSSSSSQQSYLSYSACVPLASRSDSYSYYYCVRVSYHWYSFCVLSVVVWCPCVFCSCVVRLRLRMCFLSCIVRCVCVFVCFGVFIVFLLIRFRIINVSRLLIIRVDDSYYSWCSRVCVCVMRLLRLLSLLRCWCMCLLCV